MDGQRITVAPKFVAFIIAGIACVVPAAGQQEKLIQDNSFLIEEAYNQEHGVVQHISTFSRMWNSKDFGYTFTQEWPGLRNAKHQLSYTLMETHSGGFAGTGAGFGDVAFHYRYQVAGSGATRFAFAPRISGMLPTGSIMEGRGSGGFGVQTNLPVSVVLQRRLVSHWNAGVTVVPHTEMPDHSSAATVGYNFGGSLIFLADRRFNVMLEAVRNSYQAVVGPGETEWSRSTYVSPGIRWAYNFNNGLQIVPGVAMPLGVGSSAGERGLFLYLSFEHPFQK